MSQHGRVKDAKVAHRRFAHVRRDATIHPIRPIRQRLNLVGDGFQRAIVGLQVCRWYRVEEPFLSTNTQGQEAMREEFIMWPPETNSTYSILIEYNCL
jgi:hypothetical protein